MSIKLKLYFRNAPVPSRLLAVVKLLIKKKRMRRRDVFTFIHPIFIDPTDDKQSESIETLNESEQFKDVINAAIECNLIKSEGLDSTLFLNPEIDDDLITLKNIESTFPVVMAKFALQPEIKGEKNLFPVICSWILNQPILGQPLDHAGWKALLHEQHSSLMDEAGLRNDAAWDMVMYWMRYLGFAGRTEHEGIKGFFPDPTIYLANHLDEFLEPGEEIPIEEFITRLGKFCPVLDGGTVFNDMVPNDQPDELLSDSLSFALERLRHRKFIDFRCPDDQRVFFRLASQENIAFISRGKGI